MLWEAPSKHTGAEVPGTKDCFPFQMNLHILIEGRCFKLIQCSKHRLSIYYAPRSSVGRVGAALWGRWCLSSVWTLWQRLREQLDSVQVRSVSLRSTDSSLERDILGKDQSVL